MALQVVGACFGRTGTNSLKLALEQLGFDPCHHMFEVGENPRQLAYWQALARGERPGWDEVFADYKACVDWPSARFWRELADHYPEAKVILTLRAPESWIASVHRTILPSMQAHRDMEPGPRQARSAMAYELIVRQTFAERMHEAEHAMTVYRDHIEEVRRTIAPERLLEYTVGEGWERLCAFLGVDVPNTPFPLTNTTAEFNNRRAARARS